MKTFGVIYEGFFELHDFIKQNNIVNSSNIFVQVFCGCTDKDNLNQVRIDILSILPDARIIGVTSRAEVFQGRNQTKTCVIAISTFYKTEVISYKLEQEQLSSFEMGKVLKREFCTPNTKVMIVFANGRKFNGTEFLQGTETCFENVVIAGGLVGRNVGENKSYIFNEDGLIEDGVVGVFLNSDELYVNTDTNFGWIPLGKEHIVTNSENNIIKTIDGISAVKFYEKYMAGEKLNNLSGIVNQFPLMIKKDNNYVCRNVVEVIENKYIKMDFSIPVGEKVRFGYGNVNYIVNSSRETFDRIKGYPVESLFIYSCIVRLRFLKDIIKNEMLPLNMDTLVSGFFTCGEFTNTDGINKFLTQTLTVLALSEEKNAHISIDENEFLQEERADMLHNKILFNLIKTSSDELEDMNVKLQNMVEEKINEIKDQYYTDSLTKLPNRMKLVKDLSSSRNLKLSLIDIKSFNEINDFYGHEIGDKLLILFGNKIKSYGEANGYKVYRVNSDVFAIFTTENTNDRSFVEKISELQVLIKHHIFKCNNQKLFVNTTIGMAINEDNLFEKAGMALNYTKMHNREMLVYREELSIIKEYENNLEWIKKLNEAISDDRIVPYFQAIYNNNTNRIDKYEVLIRMIDKSGKIITPFVFLNIAQKAHIYPQLTRIMINKAFEKFKDKEFTFSINILVEDILNTETKSLIYEKLSDKNIAEKVVFEIVETEGIENFQEVMEFIDTIHNYGGKIAIDDFGTGYSNFKYLTELKVDYIKIDGSIIRNICNDKSSEVVTETIVDFASKLGMDVIAEFVSDIEVYNKVSSMGVDYSQGYYFSEPKPDI